MKSFWIKFLSAVIAGAIAGFILSDFYIGLALFAAFLTLLFIPIWFRYAHDNPQHYWFKRKLFGWGWTPVTWQGFAVTLVYAAAIIGFALTVDGQSPPNEAFWTFWFPVIMLTILFIRIAYKTGEPPKWQWGRDIDKYVD